jgi:Ca2+-binding RTX toxin-like protein
MTVTVTYSFQLVQSFEFTTGPAVRDVDLVGLANGGFAAVAEDANSFTSLETFGGNLAPTGARASFTVKDPAIAQLSNGNIAVVASTGDNQLVLDIMTPAGAPIVDGMTIGNNGDARNLDVSALAGGNFVVATENTAGQVFARLFNNAGTPLLDIPVADPGVESKPIVAALDDGGFVIAYERQNVDFSAIRFSVFNANGSFRASGTVAESFSQTDAFDEPAITATDGGFAIVYEDNTVSANTDIALRRYEADGDFISYVTLTGPATIDRNPSVARMPDGLLAVAADYANISTADSETFVGLYDPAAGFLAQRITLMGEPITDDTNAPVVAGFGTGRVAIFHENATDSDIDGEALEVVRTSTGDASGDLFNPSEYRDVQNGGGGSDFLDGGGNNDTLDGEAGDDNMLGGADNDTLIGGAGIDTAFYTGIAAVTVNLSLTTAQNTGGAGIDTLSGIDNLIGSQAGDTLTGNSGNNRIDGNLGNDTMAGGLGLDT